MELNKLGLKELNKYELEKIDGGFIGIAIAGAALVLTVIGTALAVAYYNGYEDAKNACPPPPCT